MQGSDQSFDAFFSYHWRDHSLVDAVARELTARGFRVFLDRWYLTPGQPWTQTLERTLSSCSAVVVFLGADGLGPWQQRERDLALERQSREPGFPVIPVLLTQADPALGFLKLNTWVDLSANIADGPALNLLCAAIRRQPPGPNGWQLIAAVRAAICPYRGLRPFREEDAHFFCGRATVTEKLVGTIERTPLVAVIGASGSGKSSVVRAGLIPRLRQTKVGQIWEIATLVPTDRPLHSLAAALIRILEPEMSRVDRLAEINKLARHFLDGAITLRDVAGDLLRAQPGTDRLLLFVDQWEELYTLVPDDRVRQRFLTEILDASRHEAITVVFTLRGDFFGQALSDRSFADRLQDGQVNVGPMTTEELRRSIVEPAEKANLQFEHGLVERILNDVGQEPGNLPLLEFMLASLWEQRQGATLQHDAYERMGGVQGAIAARANAEFAKLDEGQKEAARRYLVQMVRPGETTDDTRQRAFLPSDNATALAVIRRLADARLVVTSRDSATGEQTVEVTHEALIQNWSLLRAWVDADREFLRTKARIEAAAALWEREKRDSSRLLPTGRPVAEGQALLASHRTDLRPSVVEFVKASASAAARIHRRTLLARTAMLTAGLVGVAGGILYWDLFARRHEHYFNSLAKRDGLPEGIGPVNADDAAHRSRILRFVRNGSRAPVTKVEAIDGSGACARTGLHDAALAFDARDNSPVCSIVWERDAGGRVSKMIMLDKKGDLLASLVYTGADGRTAEFRSEQGHLLPLGDATTVTFEPVEEGPNRGLIRQELWSDAFGRPKPLLMQAFGARVEYGARGLPTHIVWIARDGAPTPNSEGVAQLRITYNGAGNPTEVLRLDERGNLVRSVARWARAYDMRGNEIAEAYFDEDGKPILSKSGYAKVTFAYDERGKEKERAYFDETGNPTRSKDGYARIARTFDAQGQLVEEAYFDEAGNLAPSKGGYARVRKNYDSDGNLVEEAYFDPAGNATLSKDGYGKVMTQSDKAKRPIAEAYFDDAGRAILSKHGYAKITLAYDARGRENERAYFDRTGIATNSKDGYAKVRRTFDARGQRIEEAYFDVAGKPTLAKNGTARVIKEYDASGNLIEEAYFNEAGGPTASADGYARVTKQFDAAGRKVAEAYFDTAGKPTLAKGGYASVTLENDRRGNMIKRSYYDESGALVRSKDHYATLTRVYDERGNGVEEAYFDEAGKPCLESNGYAKMVAGYDARGNKLVQSGFGERGEPTLSNEAVAVIAWKYDSSGNKLEEAYFDDKRNSTRSKHGYAKIVRSYDRRGNILEETYFDEAGNSSHELGHAKISLTFDARDNATERRYFDERLKPIRSKGGYAKQTLIYDERDNLIEEAYFDESGNSIRSTDGYSRIVMVYDSRSNKTDVSYLDEKGAPVRSPERYARQKWTYDMRGNAVASSYFDEAGKRTRNAEGVASWTASYDDRGNVTEAHAFDEDGKPTRLNDGYAMLVNVRDARGNLIRQAYYDVEGLPVRHKDGYAIVSKRYDARGNVVLQVYLDESGKPTKSKDGYAVVNKTYDSRGNLIQEAYADEERNAVRSTDGYASLIKRYDARGNVIEEAYLDERGDLTRRKEGYAKVARSYDPRGGLIEETYLDETGTALEIGRLRK